MRISTSRKTISGERPLNPAERTALVLSAAAMALLFYAITTVAAVLLLALSFVLIAVMIGAARVGLAGAVSPVLDREWRLLKIIARSLWLRDGAEYRLEITSKDAPRLFALITKLAGKMEVRPPASVFIEMRDNAWVHMHGLLRGRGKTTLGIGYDLLAGLPEHEVEGILAHEMAHARLVNRGLRSWMGKSIGRLVSMTRQLGGYTDARKQMKSRTHLGETLYRVCDWLTTRSVRLWATYSRQDEFDADAGAAEACGAASIRWALIHTERMSHDLERLPWNERVARLETEPSFSRWLVGALAQESVKPRDQMRDAVDPYSTHPLLRDRIKAIGGDGTVAIPGRPGIELLGDPDRVATQLMSEIHRTATQEERKDDRKLRKEIRKVQRPTQSNVWVWLGALFILIAIVLLGAAIDGGGPSGFFSAAFSGFVGYRMLKRGRGRDKRKLPIPAYGTLTWKRPEEALGTLEKAIEEDLRHRFGGGKGKENLNGMIDACFAALDARNYLTAHVAGRLALAIDAKNVDAALGMGIAAAGIGANAQSTQLHEFVRGVAGWKTPNVMWGVAWARSLIDDYATCEALLAQLVEKQPDQPTFQSLLALSKMSRGKMRTAEQHARKAMTLEPSNLAHLQLLSSLYLESGRIRDAVATLSRVRSDAEKNADIAQLFLRLELLRRNLEESLRWTGILQSLDADPVWLVHFGFMFETARFDAQAADFFRKALDVGHFPEAHIGLARLRAAAGERDTAREHLLQALDAERERATGAQSSIQLFHDIIGQLNNLEDRRVQCRAWIAAMPQEAAAGALAGRSLIVCAPDHQAAGAHLERVVAALYPSNGALAKKVVWAEAPVDQQPIRPVAPGVQQVM